VIKTYSPNLMVHPLMRQTPSPPSSPGEDTDASHIAEPIIAMLPRLHVLVVGPGLGRDRLMHDTAAVVLRAARDKGVPAVLDADALQIVQRDPGLVRGWRGAVLTPNVVEFGRLCGALGVDAEGGSAKDVQGKEGGGGDGNHVADTTKVEALARVLGGVTIIQKGKEDYISNGETTLTVDLAGGRKRSGGQGDTLTGAIATFLAWRKAYLDRLWEPPGGGEGEERLGEHELVGLAAFGASAITKECSRLAFVKRGRSLQASDLTDEVHTAFLNLFGEEEDEDGDEPGERSGSSKL
jgi:ATP-dependent NAD(P)H-hydrate dehydratase